MQILEKEATKETPKVILNTTTGVFAIEGKSFPENVNEFYGDILTTLNSYSQNPLSKTTLNLTWVYYNTATSKILVKIINVLEAVLLQQKSLVINWYCKADDELMIEKGEEFKELLNVEFNILFI